MLKGRVERRGPDETTATRDSVLKKYYLGLVFSHGGGIWVSVKEPAKFPERRSRGASSDAASEQDSKGVERTT